MGHTQKRPVARGVPQPNGMVGAVVYLDPETFKEVRQRAIAEKTSFGEQVRTLVEWGLLSAKGGE